MMYSTEEVRALRDAACRGMLTALHREAELNAAAGRVLSRKLPVPEVFERPGWRLHELPFGAREWEIARFPEYYAARVVNGDILPEPSVDLRTERVEPLVHGVLQVGPEPVYLGLGVSVADRTYYLFQDRRPFGSFEEEG